jgi:(p)ppGpp synthase/HD superfamily hydrolase
MTDLVKRAERFARERHAGQFRKGANREPYSIHLEEVASLVEMWGGSEEAIAAAWLHDTVEDCPPTNLTNIAKLFGERIAGYVGELTDDKSLPKQRRKELQVENAYRKSPEAALVKLADKSSNVGALAKSPPAEWSLERRLQYIVWAIQVVSKLPKTSVKAISTFYQRCDQAELQAYIDLGSERMAQNAAMRILERKTLRSGGTQGQSDRLIKSIMANTLKPRR